LGISAVSANVKDEEVQVIGVQERRREYAFFFLLSWWLVASGW
jgi:hypothetical protein